MSLPPHQLTQEECVRLAYSLKERPDTAISIHLLRRGLCRAHVLGTPEDFTVAVVQGLEAISEPTCFGEDAQALWKLLQIVPDWECVEVTSTCAAALGPIIQRQWGAHIRYYGDIHYILTQPAHHFSHPSVRLLTLLDLSLLENAPNEVRGAGFGNTRALLQEGVVVAAVEGSQVVAIAHTSAISQQYADIAVHTLPGWRQKGMSTAAASLAAQKIQERGLIPLWSTGEDNWASQRVAEKIGFSKILQRTYVIPRPSQNG